MNPSEVRVWQETVIIPTYGIGEPDRNPMFLEKRVYQGSSGVVYPYPVIDRIDDEKTDRPWQAVYLENEYLKIMILPELGGRIQMALDKTCDYHFVYHNRVIKPALVGLAGPWISGGIEFNWPQHHRPNTFGPVDHHILRESDGSATVWCAEVDRMHGTRSLHGFRLAPGKAYLEIRVRLDNRTDWPQTFLWWANPAIHVDENHQSVFPPDVTAVMDHGRRDVSSFPIATGTYYKINYAPGTDISRYRNIPVPTSYMAHRSDYNFVGSYDHGRQAGLLHVASHHISPGKKQWTWGHGPFGQAWDRHLTDSDGPYIELMCGVYTDNQPDFSWLMPGEHRPFSQFFMPYKGVGVVKNATLDAAVGLDITPAAGSSPASATVRVYTTSEQLFARLTLSLRGSTILDQTFDGSPRSFFQASVPVDGPFEETDLQVVVTDRKGRELVSYQPKKIVDTLPDPARPIDEPQNLDSVESLYLAGEHLEQYRHATREPADYYLEGLRRDPGDIRCNIAMGRLLHRRGCFAQAQPHFRRAIDRLTRHNPNPSDGQAHLGLGLTLEKLGQLDEAFDILQKATWNSGVQDAAFFALARIATRRGRFDEALQLINRCLDRNIHHHRALHLKAHLLRRLNRPQQAHAVIAAALDRDCFNLGSLLEQSLLTGDDSTFLSRLGPSEHNHLTLALDCAAFGDFASAIATLRRLPAPSPLALYHLAHLLHLAGSSGESAAALAQAAAASPHLCFPNRLDDIAALQHAMAAAPSDALPPYLLGNLFYDRRQYDRAIDLWQKSRDLNDSFPTVHRNLGLALFNKRHDVSAAWASLHRAFELDPSDARVLFELDQLARRLGHHPADRLARLAAHGPLIDRRDDLYLEHVTLLNLTGDHGTALDRLLTRRFHPWEGGEGKVSAQYVLSLTQLARLAIAEGRPAEAVDLLHRATDWPQSLGEGKITGIQENHIHYWLGLALEQLGQSEQSTHHLARAAVGLSEPTSAVFYNDQPPEMIFYQGMALTHLGRRDEARMRFDKLIAFGRQHLHDQVKIDYFAVSLPDFLVFDDDMTLRNQLHCRLMMALGHLGLGDLAAAATEFEAILAVDPAHLAAHVHRDLLSRIVCA
jgi:tetratricopeptide (TPR) repeat protein